MNTAKFLRSTAFAFLTVASALTLVAPAQAEAPMVKTQPGYYRVMLGDFEVTALSDGTIALPMDKILVGISAPDFDKAMKNIT